MALATLVSIALLLAYQGEVTPTPIEVVLATPTPSPVPTPSVVASDVLIAYADAQFKWSLFVGAAVLGLLVLVIIRVRQ